MHYQLDNEEKEISRLRVKLLFYVCSQNLQDFITYQSINIILQNNDVLTNYLAFQVATKPHFSYFYYQTGFFDHRPILPAYLVQFDPPLFVLTLV